MSESTVLTHKCPNCDGPLLFNPTKQEFQCEYCRSIFTEEEVSAFEAKQKERLADIPDVSEPVSDIDTNANKEMTSDAPEIALFVCPNCGAQIATDPTTAATSCYYCHNPIVLGERLSGKFLPEVVLPFTIERKEAQEKFLKWTKKKKFIPTAFFNKEQIKHLSGVYFPYWVVDATLDGQMQARATNIRKWIVGDTEFTETKQYAITRAGTTNFEELVKNALKKNESEKMVDAVQPFDLSKAVEFKSQYLSGFLAEKRDIEFDEMKSDVDKELENYSKALMRGTINGYQSVNITRSTQTVTNQHSSYVLLPVWIVTYKEKYSDKLYYYAMNGQTGKVAGILPISKGKLASAAGILFFVLLILGLIGGWIWS